MKILNMTKYSNNGISKILQLCIQLLFDWLTWSSLIYTLWSIPWLYVLLQLPKRTTVSDVWFALVCRTMTKSLLTYLTSWLSHSLWVDMVESLVPQGCSFLPFSYVRHSNYTKLHILYEPSRIYLSQSSYLVYRWNFGWGFVFGYIGGWGRLRKI